MKKYVIGGSITIASILIHYYLNFVAVFEVTKTVTLEVTTIPFLIFGVAGLVIMNEGSKEIDRKEKK